MSTDFAAIQSRHQVSASRIRRTVFSVGLIALTGLLLRLFNLEDLGDFDFDEIFSYEYSSLPLAGMLETVSAAPFEHPPLYYGLLHFWLSLPVEPTEHFLRIFSVGLGTCAIPAAYLLAGRVLHSPRGSLLVALLVAVSPLETYYSREARMYALFTLLGVLSIWLMFVALDRGRWWWLLYATITLLALYTHYVALAILLAENAYILWVWRRKLRPLLLLIGLEVLIGLAHVPWFAGSSGIADSVPALGTGKWSWELLTAVVRQTMLDFVAGPRGVVSTRWALVVTITVWFVALGGVLQIARRRESLVLAALLAGTVAALGVLIAIDKPFQVRYLLVLHIPFLIVVAAGLERIRSWHWWPAASGLAMVTALPLIPYYMDYQRGDYQQITQRVELLAVNGDEVVLTGPWQEKFWCYYSTKDDSGDNSRTSIASGCSQVTKHEIFVHRIPLFAPPIIDSTQTEQSMQFIADVHKPKRLWFVQAALAQADPANHVEKWLTEHAWQGSRTAYRNGVLSLWGVEVREMTRVTPVDMVVGDVLAVDWYEIETLPLSGSVLRTTFGLRLLKKVDKPIKLSFRLFDGRGEHVQRDVFVGHPHHPTSSWEVGEQVTFRAGLVTPSGAKPGIYALGAIFYVDFEPPLSIVMDGEARSEVPLIIGEVELQRSAPKAVDPRVTGHLVDVRFFEPLKKGEGPVLALEGFGISDLTILPGERLQTLLVWRALHDPDTQFIANLQLLDSEGTLAWQQSRVIGGETYRVDRWIEGEFVRDWYLFDLSPTLPEGDYALELRVLADSGREGEEPVPLNRVDGDETSVSLGTIQFRTSDPLLERPPLWERALRRLWREVTQ